MRSGYVHVRWAATPALTIAPGLRLADSTLVGRRAIDRWVQGLWRFRPGWALHTSAGVSHQFPEVEHVRGLAGTPALRPERAAYFDLGVGQFLTDSIRWDATVFARRERDVLREPDLHPRWTDDPFAGWSVQGRYENALAGSARGLELLLERRSPTGFNGSAGYSYGRARYRDAAGQEAFPSDFDQRHAINLSGSYGLPEGSVLRATFRGGTNFPIPGYLVAREGRLFAGNLRNQVRLPGYARLDLRAEHTFGAGRRRLTLFGEVLNALNHRNRGPADGYISPDTGEAIGFSEALFPRIATAGARIEF
jgi:outer membrane cobalamin receptor